MASIDSILAQQMSVVDSTLATARETASRIHYGGVSVRTPSLGYTFDKPDMEPPMALSDLLPEDTTQDTIRYLDVETEKWIDKYFPELNACLRSKPEEWLCKILGGDDPYADSEGIFTSVWQQARDKAWDDADAQQAQAYAQYAQRGFAIPPGAMIGVSLSIEKEAAANIAEATRVEAQRLSEIKLDLLKFAEEQAIRLKIGIMQALADFYRQWARIPSDAYEGARIRTQAYSSLQSALSSFYQVELGFERLRFDSKVAAQSGTLDGERLKVTANDNGSVPPSLAQVTRGFTDVASQAMSAGAALIADLKGGA